MTRDVRPSEARKGLAWFLIGLGGPVLGAGVFFGRFMLPGRSMRAPLIHLDEASGSVVLITLGVGLAMLIAGFWLIRKRRPSARGVAR